MKWFLSMSAACCVLCFGLTGCATPSRSGYVPSEEAGVMTVELDDHDYDLAVENVVKKMLERGLKKGYVVSLGPVDTRDCPYNIQIATIQEALQARLDADGTLRFTAAVEAMSGSSAAAEIYKHIEFNWSNQNPFDAEDLQKFGKLAKVNGILFGRVSVLERRLPHGGREVSYRFTWKLADTETGVIQMANEYKIRKNVYR